MTTTNRQPIFLAEDTEPFRGHIENALKRYSQYTLIDKSSETWWELSSGTLDTSIDEEDIIGFDILWDEYDQPYAVHIDCLHLDV